MDLGSIARKVADRLSASNPGRLVEFFLSDDLFAYGDDHLLTVMIENLLDNAWKFTEGREKAVVEFDLEQKEGEKVFFIKDNGSGFDMTYVDKLFKPFQRLHQADEFAGTGIGLATVKRIIDRHGGRVWIEGETGKGAVVYFTL